MTKRIIHFHCTLFLACFFWTTSPAAAGADTAAISAKLRTVIEERLALMPSVARYKFERNLPVEDLQREAQILRNAVKQAVGLGFDQIRAQQALTAQMSASKMLQQQLIATWRMDPELSKRVPQLDLAETVRPQISSLNEQLLTTLNQLPDSGRCDIAQVLKKPSEHFSYDAAIWRTATNFIVSGNTVCP